MRSTMLPGRRQDHQLLQPHLLPGPGGGDRGFAHVRLCNNVLAPVVPLLLHERRLAGMCGAKQMAVAYPSVSIT
jgi:hypothetical protein